MDRSLLAIIKKAVIRIRARAGKMYFLIFMAGTFEDVKTNVKEYYNNSYVSAT